MMNVFPPFEYLRRIISVLPLTAFDFVFVIFGVIYLFMERAFGLKATFKHALIFFFSFITGMVLYSPLSRGITPVFPQMFRGFIEGVVFSLVVLGSVLLMHVLTLKLFSHSHDEEKTTVTRILSGVCAFVSYWMLSVFVVTLFLTVPVNSSIKEMVRNSLTARPLLYFAQSTEILLRGSSSSTLGFFVLNPDSDTRLSFPVSQSIIEENEEREEKLLAVINKERQAHGLAPLAYDTTLSGIASLKLHDMVKRRYMQYQTPEGFTVLDLLNERGILYSQALEVVALAQSMELLQNGLFHAPYSKKSILSSEFSRVGIRIGNLGSYGFLTVLIFSD